MKTSILVSVFAIVLNISVLAQNPNPSTDIDNQINNAMNSEHMPGVSTVIVKDGQIVWIQSYGYANTDNSVPYSNTTPQILASISKVFTGVALMQLFEDGEFQLDDNINNHLPFDITIPGYESTDITFRMLLTHTASIADTDVMDNYYNWSGDPTITLSDCIERYFSLEGTDYSEFDNFIDEQPGTMYEYSNMGTALEGYLVELISEMPFYEYCNQNIFTSLSMDNTRWFLSEYTNTNILANPHEYTGEFEPIDNYGFADYPNGMLHSDVTDLANFMITVLQGGSLNGQAILSEETLNNMFTLQVPDIDPLQGLQFYKETFYPVSGAVTLWGHGGAEAGINTEMYFDHDNNMAIAVLVNGEEGATSVFEILYDYGLTHTTTGMDKLLVKEGNLLYPNPANGIIRFHKLGDYKIYDLSSKLLKTFTNVSQANVSDLEKGIYLIKGKNSCQKLIIK